MINSGENPQLLYFIHRQGWRASSDMVSDNAYLNSIKKLGCSFLFVDNNQPGSDKIPSTGKKVFESEDILVYDLR